MPGPSNLSPQAMQQALAAAKLAQSSQPTQAVSPAQAALSSLVNANKNALMAKTQPNIDQLIADSVGTQTEIEQGNQRLKSQPAPPDFNALLDAEYKKIEQAQKNVKARQLQAQADSLLDQVTSVKTDIIGNLSQHEDPSVLKQKGTSGPATQAHVMGAPNTVTGTFYQSPEGHLSYMDKGDIQPVEMLTRNVGTYPGVEPAERAKNTVAGAAVEAIPQGKMHDPTMMDRLHKKLDVPPVQAAEEETITGDNSDGHGVTEETVPSDERLKNELKVNLGGVPLGFASGGHEGPDVRGNPDQPPLFTPGSSGGDAAGNPTGEAATPETVGHAPVVSTDAASTSTTPLNPEHYTPPTEVPQDTSAPPSDKIQTEDTTLLRAAPTGASGAPVTLNMEPMTNAGLAQKAAILEAATKQNEYGKMLAERLDPLQQQVTWDKYWANEDFRQRMDALKVKSDQQQAKWDALSHKEVDPQHYWHSKSAFEKVMGVVGLMLGGFLQGYRPKAGNPAEDLIKQAVAEDVQSQRDNLQIQKDGLVAGDNELARNYNLFKDMHDATLASIIDKYNDAKALVLNQAAQNGDPQLMAEAQKEAAKIDMNIAEIALRLNAKLKGKAAITGLQAVGGPSTAPAAPIAPTAIPSTQEAEQNIEQAGFTPKDSEQAGKAAMGEQVPLQQQYANAPGGFSAGDLVGAGGEGIAPNSKITPEERGRILGTTPLGSQRAAEVLRAVMRNPAQTILSGGKTTSAPAPGSFEAAPVRYPTAGEAAKAAGTPLGLAKFERGPNGQLRLVHSAPSSAQLSAADSTTPTEKPKAITLTAYPPKESKALQELIVSAKAPLLPDGTNTALAYGPSDRDALIKQLAEAGDDAAAIQQVLSGRKIVKVGSDGTLFDTGKQVKPVSQESDIVPQETLKTHTPVRGIDKHWYLIPGSASSPDVEKIKAQVRLTDTILDGVKEIRGLLAIPVSERLSQTDSDGTPNPLSWDGKFKSAVETLAQSELSGGGRGGLGIIRSLQHAITGDYHGLLMAPETSSGLDEVERSYMDRARNAVADSAVGEIKESKRVHGAPRWQWVNTPSSGTEEKKPQAAKTFQEKGELE
jgi:hypothetical protein